MAWQLWHLTEVFFACQPRASSGMPRNAATRSCSLMTCSPAAVSSTCAGEVVPQNGQTSACLAGFHSASAPHAGQENFFWAVASGIGLDQVSGMTLGRTRGIPASFLCRSFPWPDPSTLQKLIQRRPRDAPGRADLLAFEFALLQRRPARRLRSRRELRATSPAPSSSGMSAGAGAARWRCAAGGGLGPLPSRPSSAGPSPDRRRGPRRCRPCRRLRRRPWSSPRPSGISRSRSDCRPPPCWSACQWPVRLRAARRRFRR